MTWWQFYVFSVTVEATALPLPTGNQRLAFADILLFSASSRIDPVFSLRPQFTLTSPSPLKGCLREESCLVCSFFLPRKCGFPISRVSKKGRVEQMSPPYLIQPQRAGNQFQFLLEKKTSGDDRAVRKTKLSTESSSATGLKILGCTISQMDSAFWFEKLPF